MHRSPLITTAVVSILVQLPTADLFGKQPVREDPKLRYGTVACSSDSWATVSLDVSYTSMVVIASAQYAMGSDPAVVRVRNAGATSFQVRIQNPCAGQTLTGVDVAYMVIEEGVYTEASDGVTAEARIVNSTVTDHAGSWVGSGVSYVNSYVSPVVLGQVMTDNDPDWSQFWCYGTTPSGPPSAISLAVGKHVGEDPQTMRSDESVGFLVIEAGTGVLGGIDYVAGVSADTIQGPDDPGPAQIFFPTSFDAAPTVIVDLAGMDGIDGGWAVTADVTATSMDLFAEEDQCNDTERFHSTEQAGYIALGTLGTQLSSDPNIRTGVVICDSDSWSTVDLDHSYTSMVVITSAHPNPGSPPIVVRIQNVTAASFQVRVQNPCGGSSISGVPVHYLTVDEGFYTLAENGLKGEAFKVETSITDHSASWIGTARPYSNSYVAPVVFGQVMSSNDSAWSQFWCYGASLSDPPSASSLAIGKHVGEDPNTMRLDETVGYLVLESGSGVVAGLAYETTVGPDVVQGPDDGDAVAYTTGMFLDQATTILVSQVGMDGVEGSWAIPDSFGGQTLDLFVDEDQCFDLERSHTTEQVAYLVIADPSVTLIFGDDFETGDTGRWSVAVP